MVAERTTASGERSILVGMDDSVAISGSRVDPMWGTLIEAGTYTFYCDVSGHRSAGMEGTLQLG